MKHNSNKNITYKNCIGNNVMISIFFYLEKYLLHEFMIFSFNCRHLPTYFVNFCIYSFHNSNTNVYLTLTQPLVYHSQLGEKKTFT